MIILDVEQGSPEWFAARAGIPTASCFDKITTTSGAPSKQAKQYLYQLVAESITGKLAETYSSAAMERGKQLEGEARDYYEFLTGEKVQQVGLVYADEERKYSCSPDGLMPKKGLEIKCPKPETHIKYLLGGKLPTEYFQQVQGSMFVTGHIKWDFLSYCPGLPQLLVTVNRDEEWCVKFGVELYAFCFELEQIKKKISSM